MQYSRNLHKQPLQSDVGRGIICSASLVRTVFLRVRTINSLWNDGSRCVRAVQFREAVSTEVCTKPPIIRGALAQLVARNVRIVEVRGSNPLCSTKRIQIRTRKWFGFVAVCSPYIHSAFNIKDCVVFSPPRTEIGDAKRFSDLRENRPSRRFHKPFGNTPGHFSRFTKSRDRVTVSTLKWS